MKIHSKPGAQVLKHMEMTQRETIFRMQNFFFLFSHLFFSIFLNQMQNIEFEANVMGTGRALFLSEFFISMVLDGNCYKYLFFSSLDLFIIAV